MLPPPLSQVRKIAPQLQRIQKINLGVSKSPAMKLQGLPEIDIDSYHKQKAKNQSNGKDG